VKGVAQAPDISPADIDTMFSTNVTGLINMTQAILPIFKARSTPSGDIINIGSIAGREPYQGGSIYCATKAAVRSFTDAMRKELIATRIRVIEIDPGQVETEFSVVRFGGDKEKAKKVYEGVEPLTPEDIAEVVVFAAGRRENVVLADSLIFPNHQVCTSVEGEVGDGVLTLDRRLRRLCIGNLLVSRCDDRRVYSDCLSAHQRRSRYPESDLRCKRYVCCGQHSSKPRSVAFSASFFSLHFL
jgi:hypothetical protein